MKRREYNFIPVETIVDYWQTYWRYRVKKIKDAQEFASKIDSPRFVLEDIIKACDPNEKSNSHTFEYLRAELSRWNKTSVFHESFGTDCGIALNEWNKKVLVSAVCNSILHKMDCGEYYEKIKAELLRLLNSENPFSLNNKEKIHKCTDVIIAELMARNYSLEDIEEMLHHPDVIMAENFDVIVAQNNVCGFTRDKYPSEREYCEALTEYFKNLNSQQKVDILDIYYYKKPIEAIVLIRLEGIKGKDIEIAFNNITIYSLNGENKRRYITSADNEIENDDINIDYVNAAIRVNHKSFNSSILQSIEQLKPILASLQIWLDVEEPITYSKKNISIVIDGMLRCMKSPTDIITYEEKNNSYPQYYDISKNRASLNKLSTNIFSIQDISPSDYTRLTNSANWIQAAKNTVSLCDKLLFSWYSIESLLKIPEDYGNSVLSKDNYGIFGLVLDFVPPIIFYNKFHNNKHYIVDWLYRNYKLFNNRYNIPIDVNRRLFDDNKIEYAVIFENLSNIIDNTTEEALSDALIPFIRFYEKKGNGIKSFENNIRYELIHIYCLRNRIVHDAQISDRQLNYYANRALYYASSLFNAILHVSSKNKINLKDSIIKIHIDNKLFDDTLKSTLSKYNVDSKILDK